MKLTLHEKPFEVNDGRLLARFLGVYDHFNPNAKTRDGKPMGQQLKWLFQICEGEDTGKEVMTLTYRQCGLETIAGKMLMALADGALDLGEELDTGRFVNAYYRITVENGFISSKQLPIFVGYRRPSETSSLGAVSANPGEDAGGNDTDLKEPVPF